MVCSHGSQAGLVPSDTHTLDPGQYQWLVLESTLEVLTVFKVASLQLINDHRRNPPWLPVFQAKIHCLQNTIFKRKTTWKFSLQTISPDVLYAAADA